MSKIRTFIAIEIPGEIQEKIGELQNRLKGIGGKISWTKPANIHLTLKFLGDTDEEVVDEIAAELQQAVLTTTAFKIAVKGTGVFPSFKRPRVIWVGAESAGDELRQLAEQVEICMENFGFEKENRPYSAHLTLGRVKDVNGIQPVMDKLKNFYDIELGSFVATSFYLIKSELHRNGSIYTPLKKIDFQK